METERWKSFVKRNERTIGSIQFPHKKNEYFIWFQYTNVYYVCNRWSSHSVHELFNKLFFHNYYWSIDRTPPSPSRDALRILR